jgi:hypothetical protein
VRSLNLVVGRHCLKHAVMHVDVVAAMNIKLLMLTASLLTVAGCGRSDSVDKSVGTRQAFSLCAKSESSREILHGQLKSFADAHQARLIDRGAAAQAELSSMEAHVLSDTGGKVLLVTIEDPDRFRVSVTNLGLKEKMALTVRSMGVADQIGPESALMDELSRFWSIQKVEGGVTDDPPCSLSTGP